MGKSTINVVFSIAMLNYQRVKQLIIYNVRHPFDSAQLVPITPIILVYGTQITNVIGVIGTNF